MSGRTNENSLKVFLEIFSLIELEFTQRFLLRILFLYCRHSNLTSSMFQANKKCFLWLQNVQIELMHFPFTRINECSCHIPHGICFLRSFSISTSLSFAPFRRAHHWSRRRPWAAHQQRLHHQFDLHCEICTGTAAHRRLVAQSSGEFTIPLLLNL